MALSTAPGLSFPILFTIFMITPIHCPIRLLHGKRDADVPWMTTARIAEKVLSEDIKVLLVEQGDHRLSRDEDLARLWTTAQELCEITEQRG